MPQSFAVIGRKDVDYICVRDIPELEMGIIWRDENGEKVARACAALLACC